jgi:hypothetical protein
VDQNNGALKISKVTDLEESLKEKGKRADARKVRNIAEREGEQSRGGDQRSGRKSHAPIKRAGPMSAAGLITVT